MFSFVTTTKLWDNLLRILNFIESFLFSLLLALSLCILSNKNHWIVLWKYSSWELVLSVVPNVFIHCFVRFLRMRLLCTCAAFFFLSSFTWCSTIASCALDCAPSNVSFILFWCRAFGILSHVLWTAIIMLSQICNGITYSYTISWMYVCLLIIFISLLNFISVLYYLLFHFCRALLVRYVALGMFSLLYLKRRNLSKNIQSNSKYTFGIAFLRNIMSLPRNGNDSNCCIRHIFGKASWIMISVILTIFSEWGFYVFLHWIALILEHISMRIECYASLLIFLLFSFTMRLMLVLFISDDNHIFSPFFKDFHYAFISFVFVRNLKFFCFRTTFDVNLTKNHINHSSDRSSSSVRNSNF